MTSRIDLEALAVRVEDFNTKVRGIVGSDSGLSAQGAATALALLVAMNLDAFEKVPAALRRARQ